MDSVHTFVPFTVVSWSPWTDVDFTQEQLDNSWISSGVRVTFRPDLFMDRYFSHIEEDICDPDIVVQRG